MSANSTQDIAELIQLGVQLFQQGDNANAEITIGKVLGLAPDNADAHNLLGVIKLGSGHCDLAIEHFTNAIRSNGSFPDFRFNLALAYHAAGDTGNAIKALESALEIRPDYIEALNTLASVLMSVEQWEQARKHLLQATATNPDYPEAWINLCGVLQELKLLEDAVDAGERSIILVPDSVKAIYNLARAYGRLEQWDKALGFYERCIELDPKFVDAFSNKAQLLTKLNRFVEAERASCEALELSPDNSEALKTLALSLASQGRYDEAIPTYRRSIELEPDDAETRFNYANSLLVTENFSAGWIEYDHGLRPGCRGELGLPDIPVWTGEPLHDRRIYVYGEQGIGEQIMYATMMGDLIEDGASILYGCDKRLVPIFARSMGSDTFTTFIDAPDLAFTTDDIDYRIAVGSLGRFYRRSVEDFKPGKSFLRPDPELVERYKATYDTLGEGVKIGISWKTASPHQSVARNFPFALWKPIFEIPGCTFVSLQYGDVEEDCARVKNELGVDIFVDPDVSALDSLEQGMAQTCAVDMVVSISNATVDLAASCGVNTWMMLGKAPHWHWFHNRDDSLWYETVRVFRQKQLGNWEDVIEAVAEELPVFINTVSH